MGVAGEHGVPGDEVTSVQGVEEVAGGGERAGSRERDQLGGGGDDVHRREALIRDLLEGLYREH